MRTVVVAFLFVMLVGCERSPAEIDERPTAQPAAALDSDHEEEPLVAIDGGDSSAPGIPPDGFEGFQRAETRRSDRAMHVDFSRGSSLVRISTFAVPTPDLPEGFEAKMLESVAKRGAHEEGRQKLVLNGRDIPVFEFRGDTKADGLMGYFVRSPGFVFPHEVVVVSVGAPVSSPLDRLDVLTRFARELDRRR